MHVTHFEAGAIAAEASWPEGGETALVGQFGQRIGLIHELAELRAAEEITDHRAERLRIDELLRGDLVDTGIKQGHALAHQTLGAGEAHAALVGQQFTDRTDAAAAEVIDIVGHPLALAQFHEILHRGDEVVLREDALLVADAEVELLVDLVTSHAAEVVTLGIEEQALQHAAGILHGRRVARAQLAVDVLQGLFLVVSRVLLEGLDDRVVVLRVDHLDQLVAEGDQLADGRGVAAARKRGPP